MPFIMSVLQEACSQNMSDSDRPTEDLETYHIKTNNLVYN